MYVPALCTPQHEAWLYIGTFGPGELGQQLFDVTVRHPAAERYLAGAAKGAGYTANKGEEEKRTRYPPKGGRSVIPMVHETWGRLGDEAESRLATWVAAAKRRAYRRGRQAGDLLPAWRQRLDGSLHRSIAIQIAAATCGLPGRKAYRPKPEDLTALEAGRWK